MICEVSALEQNAFIITLASTTRRVQERADPGPAGEGLADGPRPAESGWIDKIPWKQPSSSQMLASRRGETLR